MVEKKLTGRRGHKPPRLYRLSGLAVNQQLHDIIVDICKFAKQVASKEFEPNESKWIRWYVLRWPAVKKRLNEVDFLNKQSGIDLGTIRSEFK